MSELTYTECSDGRKEWTLEGKFHHPTEPALTWPDGTREWLRMGLPHRTDGPAVVYADGKRDWCVNDQWINDTAILNALYDAGRTNELRLILEAWTPDGPTIDELAAAVEQTPK